MNNCLLLLKGFNNYFNRIVKYYATVDDYISRSADYKINDSINFNPADYINTEQILNVDQNLAEADYLLVLDETANHIESRWFILESHRLRNGQYSFRLRRDVIGDHLPTLVNDPIFVEKAMVNQDDPMLFNGEGMLFNRIKQSELLLKDYTKTPWIVGYVAKNLTAASVTVQTNDPEAETGLTINEIATAVGLKPATISAMINPSTTPVNYLKYNQGNFIISYQEHGLVYTQFNFVIQNNIIGNGTTGFIRHTSQSRTVEKAHPKSLNSYWLNVNPYGSYLNDESFCEIIAQEFDNFKADYELIFGQEYISSETIAKLQSFNGRKITYLGNTYVMQIAYESSEAESKYFNWSTYTSVRRAVEGSINYPSNPPSNVGEIMFTQMNGFIYILLTSAATKQASVDITPSIRPANEQIYDMFVMPYFDIKAKYIDNGNTISFKSSGEICRQIASALAIKFDASIYDIQLLPYFPVDCIYGTTIDRSDPDDPIIDINNPAAIDEDYSIIKDSDDNPLGIILWCNKTSFTNVLNYQIVVSDLKISNECDLYRLTSPNYNGMFEFSVAKNGGSVDYFVASCTYKPYNPYIRVAPNFKGLYGKEFGDARGLILGGDFSLPRISSAWEQYELQNKNYNLIFDRQIQNLDFTQDIQMRHQVFNATVGTITGSSIGAAAGFQMGGIYGAAAGAAIGFGASAVGGALDTFMLSQVQKEQKDYQIDMFNYQLGNIRALPYSLTKVGTFDISNKLFPFVEYYTCSESEQLAMENKIKYESMTVMRIGTITEFLANKTEEYMYFKGRLIRTTIAGDTHLINEINIELMKGVYF